MTISIMTVFLGMLAGISLLAFINHFFISLRLNWNSLHLRFSAVCLTAMVYTLCTMLEYQTTSIDSYFNLIRVQMFAVSFFMTIPHSTSVRCALPNQISSMGRINPSKGS